RGGVPAGSRLAGGRDGSVRLGQPAGGVLAADGDAPGARHDRIVRAVRRPDDDRDHGVDGDGRRRPLSADHCGAPPSRPAAGHRRLRHRPFLAGPAEPDEGDHPQDRPLVHRRAAPRRERVGAGGEHRPAGSEPGPGAAGGGRGDRAAAGIPGRARLLAGTGLPVQQGGAGRAARAALPQRPPRSRVATLRSMTISITDDARARVLEVRGREHDPQGLTLWVEVVGTAANAYTYDMAFLRRDEIDPTDLVTEAGEIAIVVPQTSAAYLDGATIALDGQLGGGLVIDNPNTPSPDIPGLEQAVLEGTVEQRVRQVVDLYVNPAIAAHRGSCEVVGVE